VALGWGVILKHVVVHAFFHVAISSVLRKGRRLMNGTRATLIGLLGNLSGSIKEMIVLALATVAATM
jgi:hypothetical protein